MVQNIWSKNNYMEIYRQYMSVLLDFNCHDPHREMGQLVSFVITGHDCSSDVNEFHADILALVTQHTGLITINPLQYST